MTMAFTTVPMIPSKEQTGLGLALSGENGPKAWSYIVRLIISNSSAKVLIHRLFARVFKIIKHRNIILRSYIGILSQYKHKMMLHP